MEIRVEEHLTGLAYRDRILAEYGGLEALRKASKGGSKEAQSDLADLELLMEDAKRLTQDFKTSTVAILEPGDLERLTPERLRLLEQLAQMKGSTNVTMLTVKLHRNKKNVSDDIQVLKGLGLVEAQKHGRETHVQAAGREIRILLETSQPDPQSEATASQ